MQLVWNFLINRKHNTVLEKDIKSTEYSHLLLCVCVRACTCLCTHTPLCLWMDSYFRILGIGKKKPWKEKHWPHSAKSPLLFTSRLGKSTDWTLLLSGSVRSHGKGRSGNYFRRVQVALSHFWVCFITEVTRGQILISVTPVQVRTNSTDVNSYSKRN